MRTHVQMRRLTCTHTSGDEKISGSSKEIAGLKKKKKRDINREITYKRFLESKVGM